MNPITTSATTERPPTDRAQSAARWLRLLHNPCLREITPTLVTLFGVTYPGAAYLRFSERRHYLNSGLRCYYVVGEVPRAFVNEQRMLFRRNGEICPEFYIWGFKSEVSLMPCETKHHPFGPNFLLGEWDARIQYPPNKDEAYKYARHPFYVETIAETASLPAEYGAHRLA